MNFIHAWQLWPVITGHLRSRISPMDSFALEGCVWTLCLDLLINQWRWDHAAMNQEQSRYNRLLLVTINSDSGCPTYISDKSCKLTVIAVHMIKIRVPIAIAFSWGIFSAVCFFFWFWMVETCPSCAPNNFSYKSDLAFRGGSRIFKMVGL